MILSTLLGAATLISVGDACIQEMQLGQQYGNTCSHEHFLSVESELNDVWSWAVPKLSSRGQFKIMLRKQRVWIRDRETECERVRKSFYGTSVAHYSYNTCMVDMAIERIEYLEGVVQSGTE